MLIGGDGGNEVHNGETKWTETNGEEDASGHPSASCAIVDADGW